MVVLILFKREKNEKNERTRGENAKSHYMRNFMMAKTLLKSVQNGAFIRQNKKGETIGESITRGDE